MKKVGLKNGELFGPFFRKDEIPGVQSWPWPEGAEDVRDLKLVESTDEFGGQVFSVEIDADLKAARELADAPMIAAQAAQEIRDQKINEQLRNLTKGQRLLALAGGITNIRIPNPTVEQLAELEAPEFKQIESIWARGGVQQSRPLVVSLALPSFWLEADRDELLAEIDS